MGAVLRLLIAADIAADAEVVRKQLADEFKDMRVSTGPAHAIADFESNRSDILVLGFNGL